MTELYRIFYSWQSDSDQKTNRNFIKDALGKAIKDANKDIPIDDSTRGGDIALDEATSGMPGAPDIPNAIFSKIKEASIIVCDVSIIMKKETEKTLATESSAGVKIKPRSSPNPNVLIELGYAGGVRGWDNIILVMNTAYGDINELPFDIKHRSIVPYCLSSDDLNNSEKKSGELKKLRAVLLSKIKLYLDNQPPHENDKAVLSEHDSELFKKFKIALPSNSKSILHLKEQNLDNSFNDDVTDDLERFCREWSNAEYEFIDIELERLKKEFIKLAEAYLYEEARHGTSTSGKFRISSYREDSNMEVFEEFLKKLHQQSDEVYNIHQELIRTAQQKLGNIGS